MDLLFLFITELFSLRTSGKATSLIASICLTVSEKVDGT